MIRRPWKQQISQSFKVGMVRQAWSFPKSYHIVSQLHLKNEVNHKVGFLHVVRDP